MENIFNVLIDSENSIWVTVILVLLSIISTLLILITGIMFFKQSKYFSKVLSKVEESLDQEMLRIVNAAVFDSKAGLKVLNLVNLDFPLKYMSIYYFADVMKADQVAVMMEKWDRLRTHQHKLIFLKAVVSREKNHLVNFIKIHSYEIFDIDIKKGLVEVCQDNQIYPQDLMRGFLLDDNIQIRKLAISLVLKSGRKELFPLLKEVFFNLTEIEKKQVIDVSISLKQKLSIDNESKEIRSYYEYKLKEEENSSEKLQYFNRSTDFS